MRQVGGGRARCRLPGGARLGSRGLRCQPPNPLRRWIGRICGLGHGVVMVLAEIGLLVVVLVLTMDIGLCPCIDDALGVSLP